MKLIAYREGIRFNKKIPQERLLEKFRKHLGMPPAPAKPRASRKPSQQTTPEQPAPTCGDNHWTHLMGLSAKTRSHPTKLPFIVTTENNMLCLRAMRHVRRGEVFDDPLGMEVPTVRHHTYCEIDGLRIMYNVFQQLPFYPGSMWHRNGLCSDRLGGWLTPDDRTHLTIVRTKCPRQFPLRALDALHDRFL